MSEADGLTRAADGAASAEVAEQDSSEAQPVATQDEKVNVNPVLNEGGMTGSENVRLMNVLDSAPASTRALEQFAMADTNWLDGSPGGMFDWGLLIGSDRENVD